MPEGGVDVLTYTLSSADSVPLYEQLVSCLREDILSGRLPPGAHLPSKRSFAGNLGVSSITVDGVPVDSALLSPAPAGSVVDVTVRMG